MMEKANTSVNKPLVLVADDDADALYIYEIILRIKYDIIKANNGREAVQLYKQYKPDITLMDINMPVMMGDEAITRIFKHDPKARILAVTANDCTEAELGVPILRKGFSNKDLIKMVDWIIGDQMTNRGIGDSKKSYDALVSKRDIPLSLL